MFCYVNRSKNRKIFEAWPQQSLLVFVQWLTYFLIKPLLNYVNHYRTKKWLRGTNFRDCFQFKIEQRRRVYKERLMEIASDPKYFFIRIVVVLTTSGLQTVWRGPSVEMLHPPTNELSIEIVIWDQIKFFNKWFQFFFSKYFFCTFNRNDILLGT